MRVSGRSGHTFLCVFRRVGFEVFYRGKYVLCWELLLDGWGAGCLFVG